MLSFMGNSGVIAAAGAGALPAYSLDFEASSTQYLSMSSANFGWSDADTWALAFSHKRETAGTQQGIFSKYVHASSRGVTLNFASDNTLIITVYDSGNNVIATAQTSNTYASTSAWYHFYVEFSKSGETVKIYEGGTEASYSSRTNPSAAGNSANIGTAPVQWGALEGVLPLDGLLHQATFFDGTNPGVGTVFNGGALADLSGVTGAISLLDGAGGDPTSDAINANAWTNNNGVTAVATVPS